MALSLVVFLPSTISLNDSSVSFMITLFMLKESVYVCARRLYDYNRDYLTYQLSNRQCIKSWWIEGVFCRYGEVKDSEGGERQMEEGKKVARRTSML